MKETQFPTVEEAIYLHGLLIGRFGGKSGVHDLGLLESALARPRSGFYKTLSEQAAALMHSLAKNRCFQDSNKRMSLALTAVFLLMNGYNLTVSPKESESYVVNLAASKKITVLEIAEWIESHLISE